MQLKGMTIPFLYNDEKSFSKLIEIYGDKVSAIVMEPVRNIKPSPTFFKTVNKYKKKYNAILIIDEISSGLDFLQVEHI